jgi:hypothetical protein
MCKFHLSIWPSHLLQWNGYLLDGEEPQIIKYWLWSVTPNSASDRIGPRTRLFRPLRTRSSRPLPVEREAEGLLCSCWSPSPNSVSRSWLYLYNKQNYRTDCTKFCDFHYMGVALLLMAHTKRRDQRRRWSSIISRFTQQSTKVILIALHKCHYLSLHGYANLSYLVIYLWFTSQCCLYFRIYSTNLFQSNFSANRILPSSYLFWEGKRLVDYL